MLRKSNGMKTRWIHLKFKSKDSRIVLTKKKKRKGLCVISNGNISGFSVLTGTMHFENRKEVLFIESVFSFTGETLRVIGTLNKIFSMAYASPSKCTSCVNFLFNPISMPILVIKKNSEKQVVIS